MKRFVLLRMSVAFLAAALPCGVLAQAQPAPKPVQPAPKSGPVISSTPVTPLAALPFNTHAPQAQTDLLTGVRGHVSLLRSIPIPRGPQSLHENGTQRTVEEVKILHNWNGEPASAGWSFNIKTPK